MHRCTLLAVGIALLIAVPVVLAPSAEAGIPFTCRPNADYVTELYVSGDIRNGDVTVGSTGGRPVECYY